MPKKTVYERITLEVLSKLEQGTIPWRRPWGSMPAGAGMPGNLVSGKAYRGFNVLATGMAGFDSPWWLTFNQLRKLGGSLRPEWHKGGEEYELRKGAATLVTYFDVKERFDKKTGERSSFGFWRGYSVFNVEQCEGLAHKRLEVDAEERPEFERIEAAEALASCYGAVPIGHGGGKAYYSPSQDRIQLPPREAFPKPAEYYSTLFHEQAHSTGHRSRLAREGVTNAARFGSHAYSKEELVAEMAACFLCGEAGIDCATLDNSAAYIDNWRRKLSKDPKLILQAASAASKAADWITGRARKAAEGEALAA